MLDPDEKRMLERALRLSEENNKMLHKMRRAQLWSSIVRIVYWGVILGGAALAWYYLKPVYVELINAYMGVSDSLGSLSGTSDSLQGALDGMLEQFGN